MQLRCIHLPADKLETYQRFAQSAIDIIDGIYGDPSIDENFINAYADERFSASLFEVVGDGLELSDYKNYKTPAGRPLPIRKIINNRLRAVPSADTICGRGLFLSG